MRQSGLVRIFFAALALPGSCLLLAQPMESLRDDDGQLRVMDAPAARMVTLAPSLTELVFAAGAGDRLAGVSAHSDYPAGARRLPQVADAAGIGWESLLALKPDLVLAWKGGTRPEDISRLNSLGVKVFVVEIKHLDDVARTLQSIGKLVARSGPAERAAEVFRRRLNTLRISNADKPTVKTFFEVSSRPLMTINGDHVISEMIHLCGGSNVFEDAPGLVNEPSPEELLARGPDAVLYGKSAGEKQRANGSVYDSLPAVREGRIYGITADYAFRPGPRLLLATDEICNALDRARASMKVRMAR